MAVVITPLVPGPEGPAGPVGPEGPQGDPGGNFRHVQSVANTTWTAVHNLGFWPNVVTIDSSHRVIEGDVNYPDANTVTVTFNAAVGGEMFLS